jgi:TPR repeat protein
MGTGKEPAMKHATNTCAMAGADRFAADAFFELGLMHATGPRTDLVSAHKWFNLAALQGNKEAVRLRLEIALEMSKGEIATAQRAARNWLTTH